MAWLDWLDLAFLTWVIWPVGWCKLGNWAASTHWWPSVLQTRQLRNPWLLFRLMSQYIMGWGTPSPRLTWNRSGVFIGVFWALCMIGSLDWNGLRPARMVCGPTFPGLNFFGVTLRIPRGFRPFGSKVSGLCWTKIQLLPLCCRRWWRFFRTWRRAVGSLCKCLLEAEWSFVQRTRSVSLLGARFVCPGVMGRVVLPACVFSDLADQFASSRRLQSLRLPDFL